MGGAARMILVPCLADIEKIARSGAERRVARLLSRVDVGTDAVAFYSVGLRSHAYKQQGEADFVILRNDVVILVEVKGGGIRKHDGIWWSISRRDDWHALKTSPMEQARSAMYALRSIFNSANLGWYANEAIVITPDIDAPPTSHEWEPTHWLAKDEMTVRALTDRLDTITAGARTPPSGQRRASTATLRARLFGEFTRMPVIDAQRGAIIEEQNRATEGQATLLASLARNPRIMVFGGAGTGKSLALVEAAKQEAEQGRSVLITFRSPELPKFFAPHVVGRDIDVIPFSSLTTTKIYDVAFIDEAQDLMTADVMDTLDVIIAGGRTKGRWRMFLDKNNQAHVDGGFDEDVAEIVTSEALVVDLTTNVRNTKAIVHMVQEYLGADVGDPAIVHGDKVNWRTVEGMSDVGAAEEVAMRLTSDGVSKSDIWIISASSDAAPYLTMHGFVVTSPKYAKGLESEHVIVCDLPAAYDTPGCAAFYVAVTRARVTLHIVVSKDDWQRLQQLLPPRSVKE